MPRVKDAFVPIEKGRYWRTLLNSIKDSPPYSVEQVRKIFEAHPRDSKGQLTLPYSLKNRPIDSASIDNCLALLQRCRDIYSLIEERVDRTYKIFYPILRGLCINKGKVELTLDDYAGYALEFKLDSDSQRQLVLTCMGKTRLGYSDHRDRHEKARDFWFHCGYREFIADLELLFFGHLALFVDPRELGPKPINLIDNIMTRTPTRSVTEWIFYKYGDRLAAFPNADHLSRFIDSLRYTSGISLPLGELRTFRELAAKVWSTTCKGEELSPVELLTLNKYVSRTSATLDLDYVQDTSSCPDNLSELRRYEDPLSLDPPPSEIPKAVERTLEKILANMYVDFWGELDYFNRYESYKGSFECIECGTMIPRSFDGYGQKYCSEQCKKRAAKRRASRRRKLAGRSI